MTFLDSDFYKKPFCTQKELAEHWGVAQSTIIEKENEGLIQRVKGFGCRYSVKQIMDIDGFNDDISHINVMRTIRENKKLQKENEELKNTILKIRNISLMEVI